jgi:hypothetical protein
MDSSSRAHPHSVPRHHPEESEADAVITQRCLRKGVTLVNASGEEVFDLELVKVAVVTPLPLFVTLTFSLPSYSNMSHSRPPSRIR